MNRPIATIIYTDETQILVQCPFCKTLHKHGSAISVGESRSSHCGKGEYEFGNVISPHDLALALKRREYDLIRKRKTKSKPGTGTTSDSGEDVK